MSKPLVFVLELSGFVMLAMGAGEDPRNWALIIGGLSVALIGAIGIRERFKAERKS